MPTQYPEKALRDAEVARIKAELAKLEPAELRHLIDQLEAASITAPDEHIEEDDKGQNRSE